MVDANLAIGPVIYGIPAQPVTILQSAEDAFDLLLTGVAGHDWFRTPVHTVGQQHGPSQALIQQLREGRNRSQTTNANDRRALPVDSE
jgi:hypothetical protein